ncbi:hypothetical protein FNV43_RR26053 [Rhamnella rubrinervis]|uniref:Uncharacterized protein n=1 Tax=Rhamnella rubrinervis TaxID=2594499 RepID=A0A8K0GJ99_9ROSA|nr:hypothetical protein FNV43_RR26053 [Rhamnella rubrinervis]
MSEGFNSLIFLRVTLALDVSRGELKMDNLDDDYDDDDELDNNKDIDEEDDDESIFLPFGKMKKWLENKPRGFGEGKEYDTLLEDKLFEEMEQSRKTRAANLNKLLKCLVPSKMNQKRKKS